MTHSVAGRQVSSLNMTSPIVTNALIDTIKSAGFNIGHAQLYDLISRRPVWHIDATNVESGESWIVHAETLYEAAVELAVRVGIEVMD